MSRVEGAQGRPAAGDVRARLEIARALARVVPAPAAAFLLARTLLLPLERFHRQLPLEGALADVGCGHGLVAQYLARRAPGRRVAGWDIDPRRVEAASRAARGVPNLSIRLGRFEEGGERDLAGALLVGVLCLVDDATCRGLLAAVRAALAPGGVLLLHDVRVDGGGLVLAAHAWRERLLGRIGFTRGEGVFLRPLAWWARAVEEAGFASVETFRGEVFLHSVFNWICRA